VKAAVQPEIEMAEVASLLEAAAHCADRELNLYV
jgi:hypothetical protein